MASPWVPPYFGSWQQMVDEALAGLFFPKQHPWLVAMSQAAMPIRHIAANRPPSPVAWLADSLISAVTVRELAAKMPHDGTRRQLESSAEVAITQILDDYCGTPPRLIPWPWPGPAPWVAELASELTTIANTLEAGGMREKLLDVAARVVTRGGLVTPFGAGKKDPPPPPPPQPPGGGSGEGPHPDPDDGPRSLPGDFGDREF